MNDKEMTKYMHMYALRHLGSITYYRCRIIDTFNNFIAKFRKTV